MEQIVDTRQKAPVARKAKEMSDIPRIQPSKPSFNPQRCRMAKLPLQERHQKCWVQSPWGRDR